MDNATVIIGKEFYALLMELVEVADDVAHDVCSVNDLRDIIDAIKRG